MQNQVEQEMLELKSQFSEFLKTKGIKAKFKLAIGNIVDSAKKQHKQDIKSFNEIKENYKEENKDFVEFLEAKGIKAKFHVIVENIKRGIKETPHKTAQQIANSKPSISNIDKSITKITANDLNKEFNEFLKAKGLSNDYIVEIVEVI